jgi:uncharacterized protein (DUF2147 family)
MQIAGKVMLFLLPIAILLFQNTAYAQADQIEGLWYNQEKTAKVRIYKAKNNKFYGKIEWLKEPVINGKTRTDEKNPDKAKRAEPLLGLQVLKGFEKNGEDEYAEGTIYDPKNGKTYSCQIKYKVNTLDVRGYVGISLIGRTTVWSRTD